MEYKETKDFLRCKRGAEIYTECSADYSLPDYNGDVRRILFTDAKVHPSGNFENGDSVDFSGIVTYTMVYSDSENRINSVSFSSDYDFTVKCNGETYEGAFADIGIAGYNMRLLGPRKISAKATVSAGVSIAESIDISPRGTAFEEGAAPEVECAVLDSFVKQHSADTEREYAEELVHLDGAIADEVDVIYSDAECAIESCTAEENGASVRANIRVFALIKNGEEAPFVSERNIRVDESVSFEGVSPDYRLVPELQITSVRPTVSADESGCSVAVGVIVNISCESFGNSRGTVVTDAYRKDAEVQNSFENFSYSELVTVLSEKEDMSCTLQRETLEIENLRELICLHATPKINSISIECGTAKLIGEIKYSGIALSDEGDGKILYHPFKLATEFEQNVNINCQNDENTKIFPSIACVSPSAVFDDNNVYLSSYAYIKLNVTEEKNLKILASSELVSDTAFEDCGAKITVYYPEEGEEIFGIAKKFHTTVEKIIEDNSAAVRAMSGEGGSKTACKLVIF